MSDYEQAHSVFFEYGFPKRMIEFGLGDGTEFFLKRCEEVVSVELYTSDKSLAEGLPISSDHWMGHFKEMFKSYKNWKVVGYEVGVAIIQAEMEITGKTGLRRGSEPVTLDYKNKLRKLIEKLFKDAAYDYAFVDAGIHLRGDIVNELFQKVPVIGAHDTKSAFQKELYGYNRVKVPGNYQEFEGENCGEGITFWIKIR